MRRRRRVGESWQVDAAAVLLGQTQQRGGIEFGGQGRIDGDAQARMQVDVLADVLGDGLRGGAAFSRGNRPAPLLQVPTQGVSVMRPGIQGVTRKCRYEPLLSNQEQQSGTS